MVAVHSNEYGTGGQDTNINITETMDQSSVMAHNPANSEYADYVGGKRSQVMEYTVQEGDTLSFIASDFGVTMNSIIWANSLKNVDSVKPGQILKIPPISGVIHEIKKGDTLSSIAKLYTAEEGKISDFNQLPKTGELTIGDQIIVPDGQIKTVATTRVATTAKTTAKPFSYLPNLSDFFMLPTSGFNWGKVHGRNGVDIANSCGTPIYAAAGGNVVTALASGWNGGFGKYIKIIHDNGTETLYAHASKLLVESGTTVGKGDKIALMGTTGRSTGCHLHFEVHGAQNPLSKK